MILSFWRDQESIVNVERIVRNWKLIRGDLAAICSRRGISLNTVNRIGIGHKKHARLEISRITLTPLFIPGQFFQANDLSPSCTRCCTVVWSQVQFMKRDLSLPRRSYLRDPRAQTTTRLSPRPPPTDHQNGRATRGDLCRSTWLFRFCFYLPDKCWDRDTCTHHWSWFFFVLVKFQFLFVFFFY